MWSCNVLSVLGLNNLLNKLLSYWCFEMPWWSCGITIMGWCMMSNFIILSSHLNTLWKSPFIHWHLNKMASHFADINIGLIYWAVPPQCLYIDVVSLIMSYQDPSWHWNHLTKSWDEISQKKYINFIRDAMDLGLISIQRCYFTCIGNTVVDVRLGAVSIRKTVLPGMAIPMLKIRRPNGRLIFNMEITIGR